MKIHFRDVQTGMVEARAVIEIDEGVYINEITLLNIDGELVIEFPKKNFIGKNDRKHNLDIISFENEDKQVLWEVQIKDAYKAWRKENKKVLVYENKPVRDDEDERPPRQYRERSYDDKPKRSYSDRDDRPRRSYSDRDDRPKRSYGDREDKPRRDYAPRSEKPAYRDKPSSEKRSYDDRPKRSYSDSDDRPKRSYGDREDKPRRDSSHRSDKPAYPRKSSDSYKSDSASGTKRTYSKRSDAPKTSRTKKY